jgi:hypothetical protein
MQKAALRVESGVILVLVSLVVRQPYERVLSSTLHIDSEKTEGRISCFKPLIKDEICSTCLT